MGNKKICSFQKNKITPLYKPSSHFVCVCVIVAGITSQNNEKKYFFFQFSNYGLKDFHKNIYIERINFIITDNILFNILLNILKPKQI